MIFKNSPDTTFEKEYEQGFILTKIEELEKGDRVKINYKNKEIKKDEFIYNKKTANYSFKIFEIFTKYIGVDGIYRIGVLEI